MTATPKTATTAEIADAIGTTPRELRKFLRSTTPRDAQPGKGSRWVLPATAAQIKKMRNDFAKWDKARQEALAAKKAEEAKATEAPAEDIDTDPDNSLDELEGPTDDELVDEV